MSSPPADAGARERAVAAPGSVLVQAPAGSGKTTLLAQRYLRLLGTVDAPESILALTFTRRAAQEMRERVLGALHAARSGERTDSMNPQTWQLAVAAGQRMADLKLDLTAQPSRLRIETIDAFNAWLCAQLPISSGAGAGYRILTDPRLCYEAAARRALAHEGEDSFGRTVDRVLAYDDQRWRQLVELIADMLGSRDRWLPLLAGRLQATHTLDVEQLMAARRHFDEDLQVLVNRVLLQADEVLGKERISALSELARRADQRLQIHPSPQSIWPSICRMLLTGGGQLRKRLTKTEGFPAGHPDKALMSDVIVELDRDPRLRDLLVELRSLPDPAYSDEQWSRVRDVAQVLVLAAAELEGVFREQGAVDFAAVSLAALRALGSDAAPTELMLRLDYRLKHLLVDEFQDTSGAQLDLVRLLSSGWQQGDGRSIFCVGDPMQSIYGFRQAEVRAFLELADTGIGDVRFEVQRLHSNFRSAPALVTWINRCFAGVLPHADDRERGAIAFRPSVAAIDESAHALPAVQLKGFASRAAEANAIAAMIGEELERMPHWRIAILVRAKTHAGAIAQALRSHGLGFRAIDIEPLQDRSAVRDIITLTSALLHLGDRTAWLAILRAPWSGLLLADLLRIARAAPLVWDALRDDAVLATLSADGRKRCERVRDTLVRAMALRTHSSVARWVEMTWLALGGPGCVGTAADLELATAAFARLRELEQQGLPDPADLARGFTDLFGDHGADGRVEIMTIHKAKGLEFDMVVLPQLDRHVPPNRGKLLLSHQFSRSGRDGMAMAARPAVGADRDRLFEFLRGQLRDADALEAQRLLYVACTRAKWRLRLTAMIGADPADEAGEDSAEESAGAGTRGATNRRSDSWSPRAGSLLAVLWPVIGHECIRAEPELFTGIADATLGAPRGGPLQRLRREDLGRVGAASFGGEPAPDAVPPLSIPREETPAFDWAGETARRIGSLVHAELQTMDLATTDESSIRGRAARYRRWLALRGVPEDRLDQAAARVTDALLAVQKDPRGRWMLAAGYQDDLREHALSSHEQGEVSRAIFDRSFVDSGIRWVIDYKTSQHQGGGVQQFLDREVERYRPQLQRYAALARKLGPEPVRVGLYFPLMCAWREWVPD